MLVQGLVVGVKDASYDSKREPGKKVAQWQIDLYDDTAGVQSCQMAGGANVLPPAVRTDIIADVTAIRKLTFGTGIQLTIANVRPANAPPAGKPPR
ncbi:MAG: hypothetical protein FJ009_06085 [Chloroflexi bacterium]|nr:hypothetical protein [Chloroflexota bacterium]